MQRSLSEKQVLQQLDIVDFRHITKDKVMDFASMLQNMEPDVAKKAIEQFPEFARLALEALQDYRSVLEKSLDANSESSQRCFSIYDEVIAALKSCLAQENLSFEEKKYYIEQMKEVARMADKKDTENKHFNWRVIGAGAAAVIAVLGIGASLLGGNTKINLPKFKG
ncbi:MAG: hypothetical protein PHI27_05935 [Eubacteriales bacterium]|nr:hypothetical protein [Eubacteriales bacterium]MDD4513897.1 hypothetical protein [Eubacteriales bacterium]